MITVLYKVVNSESDTTTDLYNAFRIPSNGGALNLKTVKQHCPALSYLSRLGPDGFHWRVCIPDKQNSESSSGPSYSWWDIQDENAKLPVRETPISQIEAMFMPPKRKNQVPLSTADSASMAAKGALKGLGKAFAVAGAVENLDTSPKVPIIAFKLLDLIKLNDDFEQKQGGAKGNREHFPRTAPKNISRPRVPSSHPPVQSQRTPQPATAPRPVPPSSRVPQPTPHQTPKATTTTSVRPKAPNVATGNLMDFGTPTTQRHTHSFHHSMSMPASLPNTNESRAERLKREYAKKNQSSNRVWDEVDQRWVEVDPSVGFKAGSQSAPPETVQAKKTLVGIKLDPANAVGKSSTVQAAVHARVSEMKQSQEKAVMEIRDREAKKAAAELEEDEVRKRLEPRIKAWSEEHGKRKQLRALLASLHTILWPGTNWKTLTIGDLLDDGKVKRAFFMASRVVHPDKTGDLDAEKRFLAKRIFDALSQAKTDFDSGK